MVIMKHGRIFAEFNIVPIRKLVRGLSRKEESKNSL